MYLILPSPWLVTLCACVMSESYHQTEICPQWCHGAEFKYQGRVSYWNRKGLFLQAGVRVTKQPVSRFCRRGRQRGLCSLSWNVLLTLSSSKAFCVLYKNNPLFYFWGKFTQMTQTKCMGLICCVFFSNKELWNKCERLLENIGSVSTTNDHHSNSVVLSAQFVQLVSDPGHYLPEAGWDGTTNHRNSPENSQPLTKVRSRLRVFLVFFFGLCIPYFIIWLAKQEHDDILKKLTADKQAVVAWAIVTLC